VRHETASGSVPVILVHGGAGADPTEAPEELRDGIRSAVAAGWRVLSAGGRSLDAVEAAVRVLEDAPRFNAGRGSVLTTIDTVETDAAVMDGAELRCGAVAAVSRIANPVTLARKVLDDGRHVLLAGEGALQFARSIGFPECDPESLITEAQRRRFAEAHAGLKGTVGAVAFDAHGGVAAATSTGGLSGKLPGRVGDSPLIGCGTYADNTLGAVSCTGSGEAIIRTVLARRALDLLAQSNDPDYAAHVAVDILTEKGRGEGGLILVDPRGRIGYAQSTAFMPVGWMSRAFAEPQVPF